MGPMMHRLMSLFARGLGLPPDSFADKLDRSPDAFVVNIGDLMARWTNDRWTSTLHRVVDPPDATQARARRQSMPFFQNANYSAQIACLPTCLGQGESPRYEPVQVGPHLMGKFRRSVGR